MTFNQIRWSFENGIRANSNLQEIIDVYADKLQMEFGREGYTAFFKTHSTMVKFILRRNPSAGKENAAFLINILEIQNLGLAEQPGSP